MNKGWRDKVGNWPIVGGVFAFVMGVGGLIKALIKQEPID